MFGWKRYDICATLFTVSSLLCGFAPSLNALIVCRVLQGIGGGGLAPVEQAILVDAFPATKRAAAFALYSMAIVTALAIGPPLGGGSRITGVGGGCFLSIFRLALCHC
jgi:DHA2 family multidrug resistance protein